MNAASWRAWARRASVARLTARQAYAVALIQAGIADSPEDGLRQIKEKPEAATSGQRDDSGKTTRGGGAYGQP